MRLMLLNKTSWNWSLLVKLKLWSTENWVNKNNVKIRSYKFATFNSKPQIIKWQHKGKTMHQRNKNEHLSYQMTYDLLQNKYFLTVISNYHEIYEFKLNFMITICGFNLCLSVCIWHNINFIRLICRWIPCTLSKLYRMFIHLRL